MADYLNNTISIIHRMSCISLDKKFDEFGLSRAEAAFLISICEKVGQSQEEIALKEQMDRGAAARIFKRLEEEGYIKRASCQLDKRKHCLFPRQKTKEIYAELKAIMENWDEKLMDGLSDLEKSIAQNILNRIEANLTEK